MAGGLMQLVAYGAQDVYLTGNPKVTFFQAVYKRHTNFAMECIQQTVNGSASSNGRVSVTVARNGDLIGEMFIQLQSNACSTVSGSNVTATSYTPGSQDSCWLAERAISDIELTIGGQRIDKHYQRWWRLYSELFLSEPAKAKYGKMTSNPNGANYASAGTGGAQNGEVFLPLLFFFNRNAGLYLPLIALQYHEVRLDFDLSGEYSYCFGQTFNVWGNYVYLDTEERRRFAQKGHEYLIEQVQHTGTDSIFSTTSGAVGTSGATQMIRLSYNHPVKELIWCTTAGSSVGKQLWDFTSNCTSNGVILTTSTNLLDGLEATGSNVAGFIPITYGTGAPVMVYGSNVTVGGVGPLACASFTEDGNVYTPNSSCGPMASFRLILNGQDRFKDQSGKFFNQVQPSWHHTGSPYPGIYCYSFALKPEEHQPTGTCNFSRIDNSQVSISMKPGLTFSAGSNLDMYAVNYNVLRIQSGMGGLAFSN